VVSNDKQLRQLYDLLLSNHKELVLQSLPNSPAVTPTGIYFRRTTPTSLQSSSKASSYHYQVASKDQLKSVSNELPTPLTTIYQSPVTKLPSSLSSSGDRLSSLTGSHYATYSHGQKEAIQEEQEETHVVDNHPVVIHQKKEKEQRHRQFFDPPSSSFDFDESRSISRSDSYLKESFDKNDFHLNTPLQDHRGSSQIHNNSHYQQSNRDLRETTSTILSSSFNNSRPGITSSLPLLPAEISNSKRFQQHHPKDSPITLEKLANSDINSII
jgi:hypothetical protein